MTKTDAMNLVQEVLDGLHRSGFVEKAVDADDETVLLGAGSELDSLELITLIFELEDRLTKATGSESLLNLTDVYETIPAGAPLKARNLAAFIALQSNGTS